ncbi:hypothetical protein [Bacillus sp. 1P06AnD]|uniref:hypothetical protein n=1 Tax=Bacillus sp. 1P06AnD TaxID=3132208 RepID=UPI0039A18CAC
MTKSFSNLDVLKGKLEGKRPSLLSIFMGSNKEFIYIDIPYIDYIRGNVFVEDMKENFDDVPYNFNLSYLIYLLYDEFLTQVKLGANHKEVASYLINAYDQYCTVTTQEVRVLKAVSKSSFKFETAAKEQRSQEKQVELQLKMKKSEILRGEIILHDIQEYLGEKKITIEHILIARYLDFINDVKKNGNSLTIQKAILSKFIS